MLQELKADQFINASHLFEGFDYSLSIKAAIEGNNPGRIFVDDVEQPTLALGLTVEGYLLGGEVDNPAANRALSRFLKEKIFSGEVYVNGDWSMSLAVHPESWEAKLPELIPTHEVEKLERYHYVCRDLKFDYRANIPEGYSLRRVDRAVLDGIDVNFSGVVRDWMDIAEMWWSEENYLSKGVSYSALHDGEVVAWCTPDCVAGERIDVGVFTHPAHRRKGLASLVVAATVEDCLKSGFSAVGWHCNAENRASWKTAEKVGFERNRTYNYYYFIYDPVDHLAELGWYSYRHGMYARCVHYYEQVFVQRDDNPDYYYHLAASACGLVGDKVRAEKYLTAALDHGWENLEWTLAQQEFEILHGMPVWERILDEVEGG